MNKIIYPLLRLVLIICVFSLGTSCKSDPKKEVPVPKTEKEIYEDIWAFNRQSVAIKANSKIMAAAFYSSNDPDLKKIILRDQSKPKDSIFIVEGIVHVGDSLGHEVGKKYKTVIQVMNGEHKLISVTVEN